MLLDPDTIKCISNPVHMKCTVAGTAADLQTCSCAPTDRPAKCSYSRTGRAVLLGIALTCARCVHVVLLQYISYVPRAGRHRCASATHLGVPVATEHAVGKHVSIPVHTPCPSSELSASKHDVLFNMWRGPLTVIVRPTSHCCYCGCSKP